ncbi:hypothetical protein BASA61_005922 [Batrachochytrium salamandrivorans]|nr:hypothetical protein BASA61_005922 [Batrachochytrium salamandrivorans]
MNSTVADLETPELVRLFLDDAALRDSRSPFTTPQYIPSPSATPGLLGGSQTQRALPSTALLVASLAYINLGHLKEAEDCLVRYLLLAPTSTEAYIALVEVYKQQGNFHLATLTCSRMAQSTNSASHLTKAMCLYQSILEQTGNPELLGLILDIINRLRICFKKEPIPLQFATAIQELLEYLASPNAATLSSTDCASLLKEIVLISTLKQATVVSTLQIALLKYYSLKRDSQRVYALIESGYSLLCYCKDWLFNAKESITYVSKNTQTEPFQTAVFLKRISFQLDIIYRTLFLSLQNSGVSDDLDELFNEYSRVIEESDHILPLLNSMALQQTWTQIRMEHFARLLFLKGLLYLRMDSNSVSSVSINEVNHPPDSTKLDIARRFFALSLAGSPPSSSNFESSARLVDAILIIISLQYEDIIDIVPKKTISLGIPRKSLDIKTIQGLPSVSLSYIHDSFDELVSKALQHQPWDLDRFLMVASLYLYNRGLRKYLRQLFPRMPEDVLLPSSGEFPKIKSRMIVTVADMEAFILLLLLERQIHVQMMFQNNELEEKISVLEASARSIYKPSQIAVQFWIRMLVYFSDSRPETEYYTTLLLPDVIARGIISELRGKIPCRQPEARYLVGALGLCISELHHGWAEFSGDRADLFGTLYETWENVDKQRNTTSFCFVESCLRNLTIDPQVLRQILGFSDSMLQPRELKPRLSPNAKAASPIQSRLKQRTANDTVDIALTPSKQSPRNDLSTSPECRLDTGVLSDHFLQPTAAVGETPPSNHPKITSGRLIRQFSSLASSRYPTESEKVPHLAEAAIESSSSPEPNSTSAICASSPALLTVDMPPHCISPGSDMSALDFSDSEADSPSVQHAGQSRLQRQLDGLLALHTTLTE